MTGAIYAFVVFPRSLSPHRPMILKRDLAIGVVGIFLIGASAIGAILMMVIRVL